MNKLWRKFKGNKFLVSFSMLAGSSAIAQVISILVSPITTRLFTPEQFGFYTVIMTAVSLFGPIICLKYDMAIVVSKTERDTYSVVTLCTFLCIFLSISIGIIYGMIFFSVEYSSYSLLMLILVVAALLILYGFNNILLAHNNKNGLYKLISSVTVFKSLLNNIFMVLSGLLNTGVLGLVGSQLLSSLVGLGRQSLDIRKNVNKFKDINFESTKKVLLEYRKQPLYNASSALLTTSVYSSINLFIKTMYSMEQLGLYSLSYRVLGIPFSVISANIARVFFESAIKEMNDYGNYKRTFKRTIIILVVTIIPIIASMAVIAPWVFSFVFGVEWKAAGLYVRLLAPMFAIRLIAESLTTSFIVSKKQYIEMFMQITLLGGEVIVYLISYFGNLPIEYFFLLISMLYMVVHSIMIIKIYNLSRGEKKYVED